MKMLWIAATLMLLAGCGGGSNSTSTPGDTDQVTTADVVAAIAEATHAQAQQIAAVRAQQTTDETKLSKVTNFGHAPGVTTEVAHSDSVRTLAMQGELVAVPQITNFGPCTDMGQLIGTSFDGITALGATIENYKQCPINSAQYVYSVIVQTGAVAGPINGFIWYDQPNCEVGGGRRLIFENDGSYNRQVLQSGVVFIDPSDGASVLMVAAGQTPSTMTSKSIATGVSCTNATETHLGYLVTANDVNVTGVPESVPSNFVNGN